MENRSLKLAAQRRLESLGLDRVHAYQPQHLFVANGRKLPRVPEPSDPWMVFASDGKHCYSAVAATPMEAADRVAKKASLPALYMLGVEIDRLTETIRAR